MSNENSTLLHEIDGIFSRLSDRMTIIRLSLLHPDCHRFVGFHKGAEMLIREAMLAAKDEAGLLKEDISAALAEDETSSEAEEASDA